MTNEPGDGCWNLGGPKTYSEADIDSAIAAGALSAEAAARLKLHVLRSAPAEAMADEEHFRLVGGFNDIFVAIACMLALFALNRVLAPVHDSLGAAAMAAAAWGLAEYFVRGKRLALTAIVLLALFAAGIFLGVLWLFVSWPSGDGPPGLIAAAIVTAPAVWLHWRRFRVPVSIACGVAALVVLPVTALISFFPAAAKTALPPALFCSGLAVLALAMRWDSSDPARRTRRSDVAFWLHLLAAPLLAHPLFYRLGVFEGGEPNPGMAWIILGLYVVIGLVSLILNRRALMVSSLGYVVYALTVVFKDSGVLREDLAWAALIIGAALLLLAAFWQPARDRVVALLPQALQRRLPPVRNRHGEGKHI